MGCIARFMFQVGALPEAAALHHAAVAAGRRPPLSADQVAQLDGVDVAVPRGTEIVDYARTALRRFI